jgi:TetR/AcrR family transcriptional repressor of nem operon
MILKEKIIHESLKLFSLKGYSSTSLNDIIGAAGTSKGGFYNHFDSKENLFFKVLDEARRIWRERNLIGLDQAGGGAEKIKKLLENYKDRYLKDAGNFPGGCVFITLAVELSNQHLHLSSEIAKGFKGLKKMIKRYLDESKESGELKDDVETETATDMLFNNMLGVAVSFTSNKSTDDLDKAVDGLVSYLEQLKR